MKHVILILILIFFAGCKAAGKGGDKSYFGKDHSPYQDIPEDFLLKSESITATGITLMWDESNGADTYTIMYKLRSSANYTTLSVNQKSPYVVKGLMANSTYDFMIIAKNKKGEISSNVVSMTNASGAPAQFLATSQNVTTGGVTISWNQSAHATSYKVKHYN